jgi:ABC-2 type transport system permease protein
MSSVVDVFRAQLHASLYWYKNNKWMLFSMFIWPYLMVGIIMGLGAMVGNVGLFSKRVGVVDPAFYLFSASAVAMSSVGIVDAVAGFALYNRWLGTLNYIFLTPIREAELMIAAGLPDSIITPLISVIAVLPAAIYFEGLWGGAKLLILLLVMYLGMIPLVGISVLAASALLFVREESNIINSITPFILLLSGVFYPVTVLPQSLQAIAAYVPTKYVVDVAKMAARFSSIPGAYVMIVLGILAVMGLSYNGVAAIAVTRAEKAVRRKGVA